MDEDAHEGLLISYEYDSNDPDSDTEAESLISTTDVEIVNDDESVTSISKGAGFMQDINEVTEMFSEEKDK